MRLHILSGTISYIQRTDEMSFTEIAKKNSLKNGEMKSFKINDENNVLLCRIEDEYFAVGANCTHYGAPLEEGVLKGDTIICPWHHACFNAKTGDMLEPPAMDSLPKYEVKIKGDAVQINVPEKIEGSRIPKMVRNDAKADNRTFIILGAGGSAYGAVQSMRENGFKGNIIMITYEDKNPYDRPNLSKDYLSGSADPAWMPLRPDSFYDDYGIDIKTGTLIKSVDLKTKIVSLQNGGNLKYDKLLIATGGVPRKLEVPGADLQNIFYLRSFKDADEIIKVIRNSKKAVVIGTSFIGMETAFSLKERNIDVTVIGREETPFERVFGKEIGNMLRNEHEEKGISFKLKSKIKALRGDSKVKSILLESGEEIETDFVIAGIGVVPATQFLSGIDLLKDGSLKTDAYLRVQEDVYASGDVATFPDFRTGDSIRVEHWRLAAQLGRTAGANMAGKKIKYEEVPFFWTVQAGLNLRYAGFIKEWDEIITDGNISQKEFISYYVKNNKILAAAGINRDKEMDAVHLLMKEQKLPDAEAFRKNTIDTISLISM
ncbi:MAG TPA: FAD-dependent oxidoreductase [Ignavibacteriaceae bacterium]|nr:FAD-dependent oxidoreductase [Ignavibacteriaceae bacterium]